MADQTTLNEAGLWREVAELLATPRVRKSEGMRNVLEMWRRDVPFRVFRKAFWRLNAHLRLSYESLGFRFRITNADRVIAALWLALEAEDEARSNNGGTNQ